MERGVDQRGHRGGETFLLSVEDVSNREERETGNLYGFISY